VEVARAIEVHTEMSQDEKSDALGRLDRELIGLDEVSFFFLRLRRSEADFV
jgi:nuclear pore complex protein Nup155